MANLCDGRPGIRLSVATRSGGQFYGGTGLLNENGSFFILKGDCHYWIGNSSFDDYTSGIVDSGRAAEIAQALMIGSWGMKDVETWTQPGTFDAPTTSFFDGTKYRVLAQFVSPDLSRYPPLVRALWTWGDYQSTLASEAQSVTGPVRFRVFPGPGTIEVPTTLWPLSRPPEDFVEDETAYQENAFGMGKLIADPLEGESLRAIRRRYATEMPGGFNMGIYTYLPIGDGTFSVATFALFTRDTVPLEDPATGLVPGLFPP